ncbi:MAG: zinc ribbon domain-containing protein [Desulfitobacteriia bacterium]
MDNLRYATLSEAAEKAVTRCDGWHFATSEDEQYDRASLQGVAQIHDEESGADEDSFYVVSPGGAIGFSEDGEIIDWLFIPLNSSTEELPLVLGPETAMNFCPKCGGSITSDQRFCGACGAKLLSP